MPEQPCWPECKKMLLLQIEAEIRRIEAIMEEREKAIELLAKNEIKRQQGDLGLELRIRYLEQSRGVMDAKLYMMLFGIPIAVSAAVALITQVFMIHVMK